MIIYEHDVIKFQNLQYHKLANNSQIKTIFPNQDKLQRFLHNHGICWQIWLLYRTNIIQLINYQSHSKIAKPD